MIMMDEMIPLKVYSNKALAYMPFNPTNKKKGAIVTLLTKNIGDSIELINNNTFKNNGYFICYYMERNVKKYLSTDGNIHIEGEEDDKDEEDEAINEAVLHTVKMNSPKIECIGGSSNDLRLLLRYFDKKQFDEWFKYFRIPDKKRVYPFVYGFDGTSEMFKSIGDQVITKHGELISNTYSTATEIFVVNNSHFEFFKAEGNYELYCKDAIITWIVSTYFNCSWYLANHVGCAVSGQAEYIDEKNDHENNDRIALALFITQFEKQKGRTALIDMCKSGDISPLFIYKSKEFFKKIQDKIRGYSEQTIFGESTGRHRDVLRVYNLMDKTDQNFVAGHASSDFQIAKNDKAVYRYIERDGIFGVKGFVECYTDLYDHASVVIGVHPKYRNQGIGTKLIETMLKECPKENPDIVGFYWRADSKNKKSMDLAKKFNFKLIRKNSVQHVYEFRIKDKKAFDEIPDGLFYNDMELVKWIRNRFKLDHTPINDEYKLKSIDEIVKSKSITHLECEQLCYYALMKMGLDASMIMFLEHNGSCEELGDVHGGCVYSYGDEYLIIDPFNPKIKNGIGVVVDFDNLYNYYNKLHEMKLWGDVDKYKYILSYIPYKEEIKKGNNVFTKVIKVQKLTESASLLELSTNAVTVQDINVSKKMPMRLSKFQKLVLNDETIEKYKDKMSDLMDVKTGKGYHGYLWVDPKDDKPVCYYMSRKEDDNIVWLDMIQISDDYRGRGLSKQMLDIALDEENVTRLKVNQHNAVAYNVYKSYGFKQYAQDRDMIYMSINENSLIEQIHIDPNDPGVMFDEGAVYVFTEEWSQATYNTKLRKYLYRDRIRTTSNLVVINNQIKESCPKIRKTFVRPAMYKGLNVYLDMSYYHSLFLEHNTTVRDVAIKFYWEYINRMLDRVDPYFEQNYSKNTIFIPVWKGAWDLNGKSELWDWKVNLNPISLIFRLMRKNPQMLINKWKDKRFIFVGRTGYFTVDWNKFQYKNLVRFKILLGKLWRNEKIEDDVDEDGYGAATEEENSPAALTVATVEKIEKSTGIEINDVSAAMVKSDPDIPREVADKETTTGDQGIKLTAASSKIPVLRIRTNKVPLPDIDHAIAIMGASEEDVAEVIEEFSRRTAPITRERKMRYFYSK